jgi:hypothetical protein
MATGKERAASARHRIQNAIALAPPSAADADGLIAGQVAATGPRLLPGEFLSRLREPPKRGDGVRLSNVEAYRYRNLDMRRSQRRMTLFVVPNTGGVATVACVDSGRRGGPLVAACERIANSLTLLKDETYPLGPDPDYAETLTKALEGLNAARVEGRRKLRGARTPATEARIAAALSGVHESAYQTLSRASVSPADQPIHAALVAATRRTSLAYAALAGGAESSDEGRYVRAARRVAAGEAALRRALGRLEQRGYQFQ